MCVVGYVLRVWRARVCSGGGEKRERCVRERSLARSEGVVFIHRHTGAPVVLAGFRGFEEAGRSGVKASRLMRVGRVWKAACVCVCLCGNVLRQFRLPAACFTAHTCGK